MKLLQRIKPLSGLLVLSLSLLLVACDSTDNSKKEASNEVSIGTIAGPETTLIEVAKQVAAKKYNLDVKIVTFSDYTMPNTALSDGSIDANAFQHAPYLEQQNKSRGYDLVVVGKTFIYPMGLYSKKLQDLDQLEKGATVAIPNDPSNEARALLLLQDADLITLKPGTGVNATPFDIEENPLGLKIKEIDAAQLPRILDDIDLAAINTTYAIPAGLVPTKNALFVESPESPYANVIAVRADEKNAEKIKQLVLAIQSSQVLAESEKLFKGGAIPAWQGAIEEEKTMKTQKTAAQ